LFAFGFLKKSKNEELSSDSSPEASSVPSSDSAFPSSVSVSLSNKLSSS